MSNDDQQKAPLSAEHARLAEGSAAPAGGDWKLIGPYLAERAWGTVREDYSADGDAWRHFPFDQAHSRAYRWSEGGLASLCDREQRLCFALSFWNGRDPILKERIFGLSARRVITARTRRNIGGLSTRHRPTPGCVGAITIRKPCFRMGG